MPEIHLPEKIVFGKDSLKKFCPSGCEHAIIVCDSDVIVHQGFLEIIKNESNKIISQVSIVVNNNIGELYNLASEEFFRKDADLIIAAGSASAIECGMLLSHEGKARFTAIPCCSACGMTDFEHGDFFSYRHSPDTVVLDPAIIACVPSGTVAYDGMACFSFAVDALKHCDNIITRSFAVQGAVGILKNIIPASRGVVSALERLMYAMYFAVVAHRNASMASKSLLSKTSGFFSGFGYPRSSVCAVIIPDIMEEEEFQMRSGLCQIAVESGIAHIDDYPEFAVSKLIDRVRKIQAQLSIPRSVSGFGLNENEYRSRKSVTTVSDDLLDLCYYGSFKFMKM